MKIKLEFVLLFTLPLGYYVPWMSWLTWLSVWATVALIWIGVVAICLNYDAAIRQIRAEIEESGNIPQEYELKWGSLPITLFMFGGMYWFGYEAATVFAAAGWVALVYFIRDLVNDSREGA